MKKLPARFVKFTKSLQNRSIGPDVNNFYQAKRTNKQRYNLERYLSQMLDVNPKVLLVGEAPGHNGCRLTGVPFTSEAIVYHGVCGGKLFGAGYKTKNLAPKNEQTATAMWSVLESFETLPLIWNAFPFHPHQKDKPLSNRKPNAKELKVGEYYLRWLIRLFEIEMVIAVGNVADDTLSKMQIEHVKVRHPSYGGKSAFKEQLGYNLQKFEESL